MNEGKVDQKKAVEIKLIQANTRCAKTTTKIKRNQAAQTLQRDSEDTCAI